MYFGIFDEDTVTNLQLKGNKPILVRIFSPNKKDEEKTIIENKEDYVDILELYIEDYVEEPDENELNDIFEKLNNFILENDFDEVITHCGFGLSRSPAIMICIAKILQNKFFEDVVKEYFKVYNRYIVKKFEEYPYKVKNMEITRLLRETPIYNPHIRPLEYDKGGSIRLRR